MKKVLFFIIFGFYLVGFSQADLDYIDNDSILTWSETRKLSWDDFKGQPAAGKRSGAITASRFFTFPEYFYATDYGRLTAYAIFSKLESWNRVESESLLAHEQLHFDISELFARKMRKRFDELRATNETKISVYIKEMKKLFSESRIYQNLYDRETKHGILIEIQERWSAKIAQELTELDDFKYNPTLQKN
ncbi:DUF922 domain-containing protein [Mesonia sp. K7]|uniref:DUF922 domain-containing protein n=1 Tax=Mesonia sp. K7 TaxID=2218606 RepID=UPI000DA89067|nr:DUF922 domain-containing protein [Mesonia sp. K7]PZD77847.1 DUF922 domain-containing protein [Mesonia sp. K7]